MAQVALSLLPWRVTWRMAGDYRKPYYSPRRISRRRSPTPIPWVRERGHCIISIAGDNSGAVVQSLPKQNTPIRETKLECLKGVRGTPTVRLFLKQTSGDERRDCGHKPFNPPQLDCLPIKRGAGAKEDAYSQCPNQTKRTQDESSHSRHGKPQTISKRR